ncbi:hypothetical protein NQZ68_010870 [Dissostichus eleginoides]|nr:hypothetical protein NQZ68_010870 [Dissostichus eleginoides]
MGVVTQEIEVSPAPCFVPRSIPFSHPFNLDGSFHTTVCTSPGSTMNPGLPPCLPDRLLSGFNRTRSLLLGSGNSALLFQRVSGSDTHHSYYSSGTNGHPTL